MGVRKGSLEAGCRVNCSSQGAGPSSHKDSALSLYWWSYRGLVPATDEQGRAEHWREPFSPLHPRTNTSKREQEP